MKFNEYLHVRGAREHNLKNISVDIPKNALVVVTGLSGSGKSSLAFDTIHAEGQRRYIESLSSYARQFLELQDKPDVDEISGLSPTIAIDQKSSSHNPRSTVGTVTEIYDFLRVLFARAGQPYCPSKTCLEKNIPLKEQTLDGIVKRVHSMIGSGEIILLAPLVQHERGEHKHVVSGAKIAGFTQVRYDSCVMDSEEFLRMRKDKKREHTIEAVARVFNAGSQITPSSLKDILKRALEYGNDAIIVINNDTGEETLLSRNLTCHECGFSFPKVEPRMFSFNSPHGACAECMGLGVKLVLEEELVIPNKRLTFAEGAIMPWSRIAGNQTSYINLLEAVGNKHGFSIHVPVSKISDDKMDLIYRGTGKEIYSLDGQSVTFDGILTQLEDKYRSTDSDYVRRELEGYMRTTTCPSCGGMRLKRESLSVKLWGRSISDLTKMPLEDLKGFFKEMLERGGNGSLSKEQSLVLERVQKDVESRVENMLSVGLDYLTLDRSAMSLSGGESQRMRLATQLSASLSGVIYILDEPSIGLHPRDNKQLIDTIKSLRDAGNTVIVVEHDGAMIRAADYIFDLGPGAGEYGGEVVAEGNAAAIIRNKESLTGQYLSGKKVVPSPKRYRAGNKKHITIEGARANNLKDVTVDIPLGKFVCVTGVSGSGKSTLVLDVLGKALAKHFYRAKTNSGDHKKITGVDNIDKVVMVDQSPIGRTPRSNTATYTGVFTLIRDIFAELPESKIRSFDAGHFSFNVRGCGRCEVCSGDGMRRIEMQFMPDVYVECPECRGARYKQEILEVRYKQKSISDVLNMTVEEMRRFFSDKENIFEKLDVLHKVGLGYVRLGQSATTLSGGEAQRVKLSTELSRRATGRTLYILDEPTTGLHFEDISRLLGVLQMLVDRGNTVLIIEHNIDMIKAADWVIDMGPEGGLKGGFIIAEGTPKDLAKLKDNWTGKYLKEALLRANKK